MSLILIVKSSMLGLILFMLKTLLELIEFLFDKTKKKTKQNKQTIKRVIWGVITVKSKCSIMMSTISVMTLRYAIVLF